MRKIRPKSISFISPFRSIVRKIEIRHPFNLEEIPCDEFVLDFVHSVLNEKWIAHSTRKFNLNLGFYAPQRESKGIVDVETVVRLFNVSRDSNRVKEIALTNNENKSRLSPVRMSMNTADFDIENNGIALIVPSSLSSKAKMAKIYWGSRYGPMMGHGSVEIWRKLNKGWRLSSTKGTWIS